MNASLTDDWLWSIYAVLCAKDTPANKTDQAITLNGKTDPGQVKLRCWELLWEGKAGYYCGLSLGQETQGWVSNEPYGCSVATRQRGESCREKQGVVLCSVTPWTATCQAPLVFPRQECWSGLPFPSTGHLPIPGMEFVSPALAGGSFITAPRGKPRRSIMYPSRVKAKSCFWLGWYPFQLIQLLLCFAHKTVRTSWGQGPNLACSCTSGIHHIWHICI